MINKNKQVVVSCLFARLLIKVHPLCSNVFEVSRSFSVLIDYHAQKENNKTLQQQQLLLFRYFLVIYFVFVSLMFQQEQNEHRPIFNHDSSQIHQ